MICLEKKDRTEAIKFYQEAIEEESNNSFLYRELAIAYDAILNDRKRVKTKEFKIAINKRSKVERRFATLVRNHGLRRCRSVRLNRAKIHITMANMACNIVRMVNLLLEDDPNIVLA